MDKEEILYNDFCKIKSDYLKERSLNLKEDLKNKLIELDYQIAKDYEEKLNTEFSMTTTLEKEEKRLEKLIKFIKEKQDNQKVLANDYKKITGESIELSHLKNSENINAYKTRLDLVKKFLSIKMDITKLLNNPKESNDTKIKVLKNKLLKKEMLNLLYEFCLIDSLDIKDIEIEKLIDKKEETIPENNKKIIDKQPEVKKEDKKEKIIEEIKQEIEQIKEEDVLAPSKKEEKIVEEQEENKILTSMPKIDKLGTVSPVNVFESIKKAEEKLPDIVIPSNGLTDENTEIFIDTKNYFN